MPRSDAKSTIDALKAKNLAVSMLTGDNEAEASRISRELDIPVAASCATPGVKLNHIRGLQKKGHKVLMVCSRGIEYSISDIRADLKQGW